jgi:hypothetical protein
MIILMSVLILFYSIQLLAVFFFLLVGEFESKLSFFLNLIPFYWVFSRVRDLN